MRVGQDWHFISDPASICEMSKAIRFRVTFNAPRIPVITILRRLAIRLALVCALASSHAVRAQNLKTNLPSDTPQDFAINTNAFDYVKREEMIPMRDGVKLKTLILIPRGANAAPMLLTRTPYNASARALRVNSPHLAAVVPQMED